MMHSQLDLDLALHRLQRPLRIRKSIAGDSAREAEGLAIVPLDDASDSTATRRVLQLQGEQRTRARDHRAEADAAERKAALQPQSNGNGNGCGNGEEDAEEGLQLFSRSYNLWQSFKKKVSFKFK
jgi:hypothetical protein